MTPNVWIGTLAETPIGPLWTAVTDAGLVVIHFQAEREVFRQYVEKLTGKTAVDDQEKQAAVHAQLSAYLHGNRRGFDLPICWDILTPFQHTVLRHVYAIPYGELRTYNDIAHAIGNPAAVRAVGRANATNPIPIVIPCHRVIGSDGKLHGYGGGLETKAHLLRLEGSWLL